MHMKSRLLVFIACMGCIIPLSVYAVGMSSGSYVIQADSLNVGGGNSVSSSYNQENTFGEVGTGFSNSANYQMSAGYQQMNTVFISISSAHDIDLGPMSGITANNIASSTYWIVTTDDPAGYSLAVHASTYPAMRAATGGGFFSDYKPAGSAPDFSFTVNSGTSTFGYAPSGADITARYKNNGSTCNTGSVTTGSCWDGFSLSDQVVAQSSSANTPIGATTTINFQAGNGPSHIVDAGNYSSTITVTALAL
jgi:hypothetical protein